MSAHNPATKQIAINRTQIAIDKLRTLGVTVADAWADTLEHALTNPQGGTLKTFLQAHHGARLDTLQVTMEPTENRVMKLWCPGARTLATKATYATFDDSRRDYAGVVTLIATGGVYIGFDSSGPDVVLIAYRKVD